MLASRRLLAFVVSSAFLTYVAFVLLTDETEDSAVESIEASLGQTTNVSTTTGDRANGTNATTLTPTNSTKHSIGPPPPSPPDLRVLDEFTCSSREREQAYNWTQLNEFVAMQPLPEKKAYLAYVSNANAISERLWASIDHFLARHFVVEVISHRCTNRTKLVRNGVEVDVPRLIRRETLTACPVDCSVPAFKFLLAKLHMAPERMQSYSAVFLWDDDVIVNATSGFDANSFLKLGLALDADTWQAGVDFSSHTFAQSSTDFDVFWECPEIQQPVYSPKVWACMWSQLLDPWGWGLEAASKCKCGAQRNYVFTRYRTMHADLRSDSSSHAEKSAFMLLNSGNPGCAAQIPQGRPECNRCLRLLNISAAERESRISRIPSLSPVPWQHGDTQPFFCR